MSKRGVNMDEVFKNLLLESGLNLPPSNMDEELYQWLGDAKKELGVSFISESPLKQKDLNLLIRNLGSLPSALKFYYSKSTPWDYEVEEYFDKIKRIKTECQSRLVNIKRIIEEEAKLKIDDSEPLWPVEIYSTGNSTLAFLDEIGRLAIVSGDVRGGLGLGRPIAIGLRNFFVMRVITQLAWYDADGTVSFNEIGLRPEILSIGGWPQIDFPKHTIIECFNVGGQE
jgi:hypothetical protein